MTRISSVSGRRVWDSRGTPTVEVEVHLSSGSFGRGIAPCGASRGSREALDLRDGGNCLRGMNVTRALSNINGPISDILVGMDALDQRSIDSALSSLDSSPLREVIGGNALVASSFAVLRAAATSQQKPLWRYISDYYDYVPLLPLPEIQIFGGGAHAGRRIDIQDFMIMVPGAKSLDEVMEITSEIYFCAGDILMSRGLLGGVADEGGWWPNFDSNEEALETLVLAIEQSGEKPGDRVVISLDIAASEFGSGGDYFLALENRRLDSVGMIELIGNWLDSYPIVSVEDPLGEDDESGMIEFTRRYGDRVQIVGDDYLVTNSSLVRSASSIGACNSVLVKVNQVGTVTEAIDAYSVACSVGWTSIVSARSGETEDTTISHLATGLGCGQLKVGSFQRSERMSKWNECLRIRDELGDEFFASGSSLGGTWWSRRAT